jgi:hypothetical protein
MSERRTRRKIFLVFAALAVLVVALTIAKDYVISGDAHSSITGNAVQVAEPRNQKSLGSERSISSLGSEQIVEDLPDKAVISLKIGEKDYTVLKGEIKEGKASSPDIAVTLPAKYASGFSNGLCNAVREANKNGDLQVEIFASKSSLTWKYKGMLKYKDCLG